MEDPQIRLGAVPETVTVNKIQLPMPDISQATSGDKSSEVILGPVPETVTVTKVQLPIPDTTELTSKKEGATKVLSF